jgi:hypothetical protein
MSSHHDTRVPRPFAVLVGLVSFAVLLQAVVAGIFVNQEGRDSWVEVHGVIADVTWVTALAAAIVGFRHVRHSHPRLWLASAALFVFALAQTGIGHLMTDGGMDGLAVVHVPLAMLIFGLALWLALAVVRNRRTAPGEAYAGDVAQARASQTRASQPLPVSYRD